MEAITKNHCHGEQQSTLKMLKWSEAINSVLKVVYPLWTRTVWAVYTLIRLQKCGLFENNYCLSFLSVPRCTSEEYECGDVCLYFLTFCDGNVDCMIDGIPQDEPPALCNVPGIYIIMCLCVRTTRCVTLRKGSFVIILPHMHVPQYRPSLWRMA